MCKIILKYDDLLITEVDAHRESNEDGAGFIWHMDNTFNSACAMKHQSAWNGYLANYVAPHPHRSPFTLFHSRMPSAGDICKGNIQPFRSQDIVLAHNGTMDRDQLFWTCVSLSIPFTGKESDSLLLFKILQKIDIKSGIALLKMLDQNFILVHKPTASVHIIGNYDLEFKSKKHLLSAKNKYSGDTYHIVTTFFGRILSMDVDKAPVYNYAKHWPPAATTTTLPATTEGVSTIEKTVEDYENEYGYDAREAEYYERTWPQYCPKTSKLDGYLCALDKGHAGECSSNWNIRDAKKKPLLSVGIV